MCVANGLYHNIFCMIKGRLNAMCSDGLWLDSISAALGAAQRAVLFAHRLTGRHAIGVRARELGLALDAESLKALLDAGPK